MFEKVIEGPVVGIPIMSQIAESVFLMQRKFPPDFEFRIYTTRDLYQYIMGHVTIQIHEKAARLFGIPVYITEGEGTRWWIGVPGFVIPEGEDADTTPR